MKSWWFGLAVVAATIICYREVLDCGFTNFDDDQYVYNNPDVQAGFTWPAIRWAFTTTRLANWHPLTWLSFEVDYQLFGLKAAGYHAVNLALHCVNSVLLFIVLRRLTSADWPSAAVAAIFALHPLHVESVAWISERKDVLSGLFFMLTLWAYAHYVASPNVHRYLLISFVFAVGLMAKPMLVTLPCVLLLVDVWPLERWQRYGGLRLCAEKLPLFGLSCVSCAITYLVQQRGGALKTVELVPIENRLINLPMAYLAYLTKFVWPDNLAVYYPLAKTYLIRQSVAAALILFLLSAAAILLARKRPHLFVGCFWWMGMLVPVIGLIQVGGQAYADRYMYLPLIGLAIAFCFSAERLAARWRVRPWLSAVAAAAILLGCCLATVRQVSYWRDSETLWRRAIDVTGANPVACNSLGVALAEAGRPAEAIDYFKQGLALAPDDERCHQNLALALIAERRFDEGLRCFHEVLRLNPRNAAAHFNAGVLIERNADQAAAMDEYRQALAIDPTYWRAHLRLGRALLKSGETHLGEQHLSEAVRLNPSLAQRGSGS